MKKKILALLLAMAMTMGMSTVAFADETTSSFDLDTTVTTETHTYELYQLLTGTYNSTTQTLGDIKLGSSVDADDYTAAGIAAMFEGKTEAEAQAAAATLTNLTAAASNESGDFSNLVPGYYLIKDVTTSALTTDSIYEPVLFLAPRDTKSTQKVDVVTVTKKVIDKNDTEGTTSDWQDTADHDLGDVVNFVYTTRVPNNASKYVNPYQFIFHDTMDAGLTFNNDVAILVNGSALTSGYSVDTAPTDNHTFDVTIDDLREKAGALVTVSYTATVNDQAVIAKKAGDAGNNNKVYLQFSNNPQGSGTGNTPEDTNIIFTYSVGVNKVDENEKPLAGAGFTLYKEVKTGGAFKLDGNKMVADSEGKYIQVGSELVLNTADADGKFQGSFDRIDDGKYVLVETTTPAGYNTAAPIEFTITADHTQDPAELKLTSVSNSADETGIISVINETGALLPSTGGIGTTLFYVIGGILVVGGGAMLFVKRKMGREEI